MAARTKDFPLRLVVGTARGGTRWLCRTLNEHSQVAAFGESMFWGRGYVKPDRDGCYSPEQVRRMGQRFARRRWSPHGGGPGSLRSVGPDGGGGPLTEAISRAFDAVDRRLSPVDCFRTLCAAVLEAEGKSIAVEKTPHHVNWADRIIASDPSARLVVMMRAPYAFMLSYKMQGTQYDDAVRNSFRRLYHPIACALVWRTYCERVHAVARSYPENTLVVQTEKLPTSEAQVLERVQQFLQVPVEDLAGRVGRDNSSIPEGQRPQLEDADVYWMNRIAGTTMRRHGYPMQPTPDRPSAVTRSLMRLPWWAMDNALAMRRRVRSSYLGYLWRWLNLG